MKRSATDVIRRGFDNTLANWPLIVIRVAESFACALLIIATIFAIVIPVIASAGLSDWKPPQTNDPTQAVLDIASQHFALIFYLFVLLFVVVGIFIAIHSWVTAGCAAVFIDAERQTTDVAQPPRDAYRAYTADRFLSAARGGWWRMFWLYNATWSVACLILLIPIIPVLIGTIAFASSQNVAGAVATGCGGMALIVLVAIPVSFVVGVWTEKATVLLIGRDLPLRVAIREGWRTVRADFGRHAGVAFIVIAIMFGASAVLSGFGAPFSFGAHHANNFGWFLGPQIAMSMLQNAVTNGIGCWFLASFAALTEER